MVANRQRQFRELERCICVGFTAGELSKFAEGLRIFTGREEPVEEGARTLVRAMDHRGRLADLVDRLRTHKPLVEWPDAPEAALDEPSAELDAEPEPLPSDPPSLDPAAALDLQEPGTSRLPAVAVGGAMLVAGLAAGWLGSGAFADSSADEAIPLASIAAKQLEASVAALTRACHAEVTASGARDALTRAFINCKAMRRPRAKSARESAQGDAQYGGAPEPEARQQRPARARLEPPARRRAKLPAGSACLELCNSSHRACQRDKCGPEPLAQSQYAAYQRCQASCLAANSRCRLRCQ